MYFPTVIVCNINQIRSSLFRGLGVSNESDIHTLYKQFYSGMDRNLSQHEQQFINKTATSEVSLTESLCKYKVGKSKKRKRGLCHFEWVLNLDLFYQEEEPHKN